MLGLNGAFSSSSSNLWTSCLDVPNHSFRRPNSPAVTMFFAFLCVTQTPSQHKRKRRIFNPVKWNFSICLLSLFVCSCPGLTWLSLESVASCMQIRQLIQLNLLYTPGASVTDPVLEKRSSDSKSSAFMADVGSPRYIFGRLSLHSFGSLIVSGLTHLVTLNQISFRTTQ